MQQVIVPDIGIGSLATATELCRILAPSHESWIGARQSSQVPARTSPRHASDGGACRSSATAVCRGCGAEAQ